MAGVPAIPLLPELVSVFGLCVASIYACLRLRLPSIVGVLVAGVLAGPNALGLVQDVHAVEAIAELGVILLMFSIGLELSLDELKALKKPVLLGGGAQVLLTILLFFELDLLGGHATGQAVLTGFLVSLSSTAIVIKLLQERGELTAPHGRVALSVLIFQDIIVAPMMLLLPFLGSDSPDMGRSLLLLALKAIGVVLVVGVLARYVVGGLMRAVLRTRSRELFLLCVLVLCLAVAMGTAALGLSISLGAFLAGLTIAQSDYALSALEGVHPFRDVFTSLFFLSIGMLLDVDYLWANLPLALGAMLFVLAAKSLVAGGATLLLGYPLRVAALSGLALCQVGEFSFILAKAGAESGLLPPDRYQLFLAVSILTMLAAPFCMAGAPRLAATLDRLSPWRRQGAEPADDGSAMGGHVIIVGFGLGGQQLAQAARAANIPYLAVEMNPDTVRREKAKGEPIIHGDAGQPEVLKHLNVATAKVLAVAVADAVSARRVTQTARALNKDLTLVVRTRYVSEVEPLLALGANQVVAEEFETAIEVFARVLRAYLVPHSVIEEHVETVRTDGYSRLRRGELGCDVVGSLSGSFTGLELSGLPLEPGAALDGQTLEESGLRRLHGLTVVAIQRGGEIFANPDGGFRLQGGDVAYIFAPREDLASRRGLFQARRKAWA